MGETAKAPRIMEKAKTDRIKKIVEQFHEKDVQEYLRGLVYKIKYTVI